MSYLLHTFSKAKNAPAFLVNEEEIVIFKLMKISQLAFFLLIFDEEEEKGRQGKKQERKGNSFSAMISLPEDFLELDGFVTDSIISLKMTDCKVNKTARQREPDRNLIKRESRVYIQRENERDMPGRERERK